MDDRDPKKQGSGNNRPGKLELKKTVETGQVRQSFAHGRSKLVTVEVRKKRTYAPDQRRPGEGGGDRGRIDPRTGLAGLTNQEKAARVRALQDAIRAEEDRLNAPPPAKEAPETPPEASVNEAVEAFAGEAPAESVATPVDGGEAPVATAEPAAVAETADQAPAAPTSADAASVEAAPVEVAPVAAAPVAAAAPATPAADAPPAGVAAEAPVEAPAVAPVPGAKRPEEKAPEAAHAAGAGAAPAKPAEGKTAEAAPGDAARPRTAAEEAELARARAKKATRVAPGRPEVGRRDDARRGGRLSISDALEEGSERMRSLASVRRAREKERLKQLQNSRAEQKIVRDVIIPETITVQELANRMAARSADVIKALMRMGVMATINHTIDADTAELLAVEFGHNARRVSAADVEIGLKGEEDTDEQLLPRPPVVTVMGHVDHGKTSLLDALRRTDVAAHEAGGITQHIGAYQVTLATGEQITFIDTPGHAAFTQMRARGAKATDIVVLVVAADDGVMPQTVEAINHAKAAGVPIIVAINKIDRPEANAEKIRLELLQYGIQVEETGGDVLSVAVSAKQGTNLDKLTEAILLQSEVLDLKSNPNRHAEGVIIESKVERGRGTVCTVLVQRGTLKVGDIFVAGSEWGRVRGMTDAAGVAVAEAGPSMPVEVLGLNGTPAAGDDVVAVPSEGRAREITEFRTRRTRDAKVSVARGTFEQLLNRYQQGEGKELAVVVKADVHGSAEAIVGALEKIGGDQIKVNVLHAGVGGINETDVGLANASSALIIGFNVRANPQARELAKRDGVEIRYYSIIYELADDIRALLTGMLTPVLRERLLGYAEIREVFNITKVGKVAGCMITEGTVKRGARVRLLRGNVVIHEGDLSQLKRFKEDVREVREGFECGMALASYQDIQVGDRIECFEMEEVARQL